MLSALVRRSLFHVLVIPYALDAFPQMAYAVVRSRAAADDGWHGVTGAGDRGETPVQAARRHARQLAGVPDTAAYVALDSRTTIRVERCDAVLELPEYAFAARVDPGDVRAPEEHELCWVSYQVAQGLLAREAERNALWELRQRINCRALHG